MSKPDMVFGPYKQKHADLIAKALLDELGADTLISPGLASGKPVLLVTFGKVKPTEGGAKGFVRGVLRGYGIGWDAGYTVGHKDGTEDETDGEPVR